MSRSSGQLVSSHSGQDCPELLDFPVCRFVVVDADVPKQPTSSVYIKTNSKEP